MLKTKGGNMTKTYDWVDNPTETGVALYDPDILNECLMHLKYSNIKNTKFCINSGIFDNNKPNLLSIENANEIKFNCGNSIIPELTSNSSDNWILTASHEVDSSTNDIFKSFKNNTEYCRLSHKPTIEEPAYIKIENSSGIECDYVYLKFANIQNADAMKSFYLLDENDDVLFYTNDNISYLEKEEFLIPILGYKGNYLKILTTENVDDVNYIAFPQKIKLLKKEQVVIFTSCNGNSEFLINIPNLTLNLDTNSANYLGNGVKNIALQKTGAEIVGSIFRQIAPPSNASNLDIWLDISIEPLKAYQYNGTTWSVYNGVPVGNVEVNNGELSNIRTFAYNQNGYNINQNTVKRYDSGWFAVSGGNTYTLTHNLGTKNIDYKVLYASDSNGTMCSPAMDYCYIGANYGWSAVETTTTTIKVKASGAITPAGALSGYYRVIAEEIQ